MNSVISVFSLCLIVPILSHAYEGFRCIPSMRDTRIQVLVQEKTVEVLVTSPMGYKFMPQFDGPGSMFQLSFNKMQAEDLKELGDQFQFVWPKENCKVTSAEFYVSCQGLANNSVQSVQSFGISTSQITEKHEEQTYEQRKFRFSVEKDNMYFVSLQYYKNKCETFAKSKK